MDILPNKSRRTVVEATSKKGVFFRLLGQRMPWGPPIKYLGQRPCEHFLKRRCNLCAVRHLGLPVGAFMVLSHIARPADGYNATVLAYGQTGSGKTHTMSGGQGIHGVVEEGEGYMELRKQAALSLICLKHNLQAMAITDKWKSPALKKALTNGRDIPLHERKTVLMCRSIQHTTQDVLGSSPHTQRANVLNWRTQHSGCILKALQATSMFNNRQSGSISNCKYYSVVVS
eukprot:scaffold232028_cov22-Tisochrysis_lutea.AAC.1